MYAPPQSSHRPTGGISVGCVWVSRQNAMCTCVSVDMHMCKCAHVCAHLCKYVCIPVCVCICMGILQGSLASSNMDGWTDELWILRISLLWLVEVTTPLLLKWQWEGRSTDGCLAEDFEPMRELCMDERVFHTQQGRTLPCKRGNHTIPKDQPSKNLPIQYSQK